jgi:FkbM family methyltransferase
MNNNLLNQLKINPVLIDIGASDCTPKIWQTIAKNSIYIGFDPDLREITEINNNTFYKSIIINEAITADQNLNKISFYLTKSPLCSSTLLPNRESLKDFIFTDLFIVEKQIESAATNLNAVVDRFSLNRIDWIKIDTQGTDLRIINSLKDSLFKNVLAIDIEPGLIDAYLGEDTFIDVHQSLTKQGFWLTNLNVCGTTRIKQSTLSKISAIEANLDAFLFNKSHKPTPGWCEARYLRTLKSLDENQLLSEQYILLWLFALLDRQLGFALDVVFEYQSKFGQDNYSQIMLEETIELLKINRSLPTIVAQFLRKKLPISVKNFIKTNNFSNIVDRFRLNLGILSK